MKAVITGKQKKPEAEYGKESFQPTMGLSEEEFQQLVQSTLIMIPHRTQEGLQAGLAQAMGVWGSLGATVATVMDNFGGFVEMTRGGMIRTFLDYCRDNPQIDKVVMIDSDESVPWDAPFRLAAWDVPVVSGVVCTYNDNRGVFACFTVKDEHGVARFPSYNFTKTIPGKGLIKVHSAGTGLICIKKTVIETMLDRGMQPFYIPEEQRLKASETGMLAWGEDIAFCRRCEELGFDIYVDLSVQAVHFKMMPITWPRAAMDFEIDPQEWCVSNKDYRHG